MFLQASNTAFVPLTAGSIISDSCFGFLIGKGDAVWTTISHPSMAQSIESASSKSASTKVNSLNLSSNALLRGSIFILFVLLQTVPKT